MTENGKSRIQSIASVVIGFALVVGMGALALMSRGGSEKAPLWAVRPSPGPAPATATPANPASALPYPGSSGETSADAAFPAPTLPSVMAEEALQDGAPAAAARPAALVVTRHLDATQTTSAKASLAVAPALEPAGALPKKKFVAPKLVTTKSGGIATTVHYGVSSRSELMGRAAGPVYNFKSPGAKKAAAPGGKIDGPAAVKIEEVQKQLEGSSLDDKAKKDLREKFQLINDGIGKEGSN